MCGRAQQYHTDGGTASQIPSFCEIVVGGSAEVSGSGELVFGKHCHLFNLLSMLTRYWQHQCVC